MLVSVTRSPMFACPPEPDDTGVGDQPPSLRPAHLGDPDGETESIRTGFGNPITGVIHTSGLDARCDEHSSLSNKLYMVLCQSVCVYQLKFSMLDSEFSDV